MSLINIILAETDESTTYPKSTTEKGKGNSTEPSVSTTTDPNNAASNSPIFQLMISAIVIVVASYKLYE